MILVYVGIVLGAFIFGAVPFSWVLGKIAGYDLRRHGSGNPGATNLYRTAGAKWGIPGLLLDIGKGVGAVVIARLLFPDVAAAGVCAAAGAIAGHIWTPFLGFRGGKGVATATGAFLALSPVLIIFAFLVFAVIVAITRYVSLGSITAAAAAFVGSFGIPLILGKPVDVYFVVLVGVCAVVIIFAHRGNISRLLAGTEGRLGKSKADKK
ncbi:MAG: glycerol-3-phosphate 1-O-acyltransferase PlsY [Candidatus Zixiibacteriota bacterium]|jgi:glycerol-3-phosphate acyltransferase PlsY